MKGNNTMSGKHNKADLIDYVAATTGLTPSQAQDAIHATFGFIAVRVVRGGSVGVTRFGTFRCDERAPRAGRNPRTGERVDIPARSAVKFVVSDEWAHAVDVGDTSFTVVRAKAARMDKN